MRTISKRLNGSVLASAALSVLAFLTPPLSAQWVTQEIPLAPGWNGVQLLVQPASPSCSVLFSNKPVEKVFWWRRVGAGMEFDLDPHEPFPRVADWSCWFAQNPAISTFGSLLAGESYEIYVSTNAASFKLRVKGKPVLNATRWIPSALNLVGLSVSTNPAITFTEFFSFTPDFTINNTTATVFRVAGPNNAPQRIWNPALESVRGGEAYWIAAGAGARDYAGPIRIKTGSSLRMLDFGSSLAAQSLVLENLTATSRAVQVRHDASEAPPDLAGVQALLGKTPLLYKNAAFGSYFQPLPSVLATNIPAHSSLTLTLMPDSLALTGGVADAAWQSILRVTDANNASFPAACVDARIGVSCNGAVSRQLDPAGLWVGNVNVTDVERAPTRLGITNLWSADGPVPAGIPYPFRVILHIDAEGRAKLLQRALIAWRAETDSAYATRGTNAILAILPDESDAAAYAALHPGVRIARISSTCFPLMQPAPMTGSFGAPNALFCTVAVAYNDPVNPFVHRYHPQHDNLRYDNGAASALPDGVESYTVTRDLEFHFDAADPVRGANNRNWGVSEAGGRFEETVNGLNKTIRSKGTFSLERISRVSELGASED